MATIHWNTVQGYVTIAAIGFGIGDIGPGGVPAINHADLSGPTHGGGAGGGAQLWNYGIPNHDIPESHVQPLIDWFEGQFHGQGLRVQAKHYGGFMVNLVRDIVDIHGRHRRFNFHVRIQPASMSMGTLLGSGAKGAQFSSAMSAMFPPLPKAK